jgi:CDP-diacylglycerol pyrophosphatase
VKRGARTAWALAAAVLSVSTVVVAYAMELHRQALWLVVRACVADMRLIGSPFPCLEVSLSGGEETGTVVLRPPLVGDMILAPTRRITGIEDPFLQSPEAPNYFDAAWRARTFLKAPDGQAPERDAVGLVVNSEIVRGQDQLHIHVGCHYPYARRALAIAASKVPIGKWAYVGAVTPHSAFWGYRIGEADLTHVEPFRLARAEFQGKTKGPGDLTVAVAPVHVEGGDQFLILATYAKAPHAWWAVGSDDLLDSQCFAAPRKAD